MSVNVYSLGINRGTTTNVLQRFEVEASSREANLIVFALGINDSAQIPPDFHNWVSPKQFQQNLTLLSSLASKLSSHHLYIGLTPVNESLTTPLDTDGEMYYSKERDRYNNTIQVHCNSNHIPFISLDSTITSQDLHDGLHPNTNGHRKIFEAVEPIIQKMLSST